MWVANPSLQWTFTIYSLPVFTGALLFSSVELELKQPKPSIDAPFQSISCTAPQFLFGVGQDAKKSIGDNQLA